MTMTEAKRIAQVFKEHKPDPASATVGERLLWGRLTHSMLLCLRGRVTSWNEENWREAAGMDPR